MSIAHGYLAKSAQVAGVSLSGMTVFGTAEGAQVVTTKSDGDLFEKITPLIPGNTEVSVQTRDIAASISVGTSGALSLVADKMVGGKTLTGTVTYSASSCTVLSVSRGTDIEGQAVLNVSARINSADGSTSGLTITVA
jgi:hypothetical protein